MNAAQVGYTGMDGQRYDHYGAGAIKLALVTTDGTHVDFAPESDSAKDSAESTSATTEASATSTSEAAEKSKPEDALKAYVVIAQNTPPNSEIKLTFEADSSGEESDYLVDSCNYDEVVLVLASVGSDAQAPELTEVKASPDKYTRYIKDYVGRNLADCGYVSFAGWLCDHYAAGYVKFEIASEDGSFVDPKNPADLASYVVTSQSVEPNTELKLTYSKRDDGTEYSNLVDNQSIQTITLKVKKLAD